MTRQQAKDGWNKWGPTIVTVGLTLLIQLITFAYIAGRVGQKLDDIEYRLERVENKQDSSI